MSDARRRKRRKRQLHERQEGLCYWCSCEIKFYDNDLDRQSKPDAATLDHLRHRSNPSRYDLNFTKEERTVLACQECNLERGNAAERLRDLKPEKVVTLRKPMDKTKYLPLPPVPAEEQGPRPGDHRIFFREAAE